MRGSMNKGSFLAIIALGMMFISGCKGVFDNGNGNGAAPPEPVYPCFDAGSSWSPDGSTIVYTHEHITRIDSSGLYHIEEDSSGLWLIDPDGSNRRMFLSGGERVTGGRSDWSPDGEWIALHRARKIWKVRANGDDLIQLTSGEGFCPAWSPDGKKIAYCINAGDSRGVWIIDSDGGSNHKIGELAWTDPDWSSEGDRIIFSGWIEADSGICIADTNGENPECVHTGNPVFCGNPSFSPDGSKIVFVMQDYGGPNQVWVVNSDGSDPRRLTTEGGDDPCWSPDGRYIVYTQHDGRKYDPQNNGVLFIMRSDGSEKRQLTFGISP
jgi:Tol biopolymer transport system component